jgi:uncharacterized integral membrane protein
MKYTLTVGAILLLLILYMVIQNRGVEENIGN